LKSGKWLSHSKRRYCGGELSGYFLCRGIFLLKLTNSQQHLSQTLKNLVRPVLRWLTNRNIRGRLKKYVHLISDPGCLLAWNPH
jgi:hypothetical protein